MPAPRLGGGSTALVTATTLNTFTSNWRRNHETVVSGHMALFGTLKDVQMRQRRNGHVFFVTSMGGLRTFPGLSAYHGSKFALEGIAATIAQEVAPFGIHVTAVESSSFRTDWAGRSMTRVRRTITDTSYSAATPFASSPRHEPSLTRKQRGGRSCRYPRTTGRTGSRGRAVNVTIAGAHEQIAFRLARLLAAKGDRVIGLIRNPDHATEVSRTGAAPSGATSSEELGFEPINGGQLSVALYAEALGVFAVRLALDSGYGRPSASVLFRRGVIPLRQHFEPATEAPAGSVVGHPRRRRRVTRRSRR